MRVLIAEDERATAHLLKTVLQRGKYEVDLALDGQQALEMLRAKVYDALLTDWRMPRLDGIELIEATRREIKPTPLLIMITSVDTLEGRITAIEAGVDDYVSKPIRPLDLLERVEDGLTRLRISRRFLGLGVLTSDPPASMPPAALKTPTPRTPTPKAPTPRAPTPKAPTPRAPTPKAPTPKAPTPKTPTPRATLDARPLARGPYTALAVTASTGGPTALITFFEALNAASDVTIFVVLHGPEWMLRTYTQRLAKAARRPVHYVEAGEACQPGAVYLAAGDRHMRVKRRMGAPWVEAFDGPKENFVRPAADPLFHSVAEVYGAQAAAVVLTGMGRDGTRGAQAIAAAGGLICAQTPDSAVAPSMPTSVIRQEIVHHQGTPEGLAAQLSRRR